MKEQASEPSRELTPRDQDRLLIVAYWRGSGSQEPHIGYGFAKGHVWSTLFGVAVMIISRPISLFLFPRLRTRRAGCLVELPIVVWGVIGLVWSWRIHPTLGFYELDGTGRPVRFLTAYDTPASIRGRTGSGRKAFLLQTPAPAHGT